MTDTELMLAAQFEGPTVPLDRICERYFGVGIEHAKRMAALNRLPVPVFRLVPSQKAPYMVSVRALAAFIDAQAEAAQASHEDSQL